MSRPRFLEPKFVAFIPLLLILLIAVACGEDATPTPRPTDTPVPPTAVPAATATPVPATAAPAATATARPAPATAKPAPTSTPVPVPTVPKALGPPTATTPPVKDELEPVYGGIVPMHNRGVNTWDPHAARTLLDNVGSSPHYTNLLMYDPLAPGTLICDLCESFSINPDGKSYTFKLRKGVEFWDGVEVTAKDVAFSFDRVTDPDIAGSTSGILKAYYDRSEVVDPYTVILHNKAQAAAFTRIIGLDVFKVMPKHWIEAGNDPHIHANILGSGPFMPVSYTEAIRYEAEKNPNFFREGLPYFDGYMSFIMTDPGTELAALKTEKVFMASFNLQSIESLDRLVKDEEFLTKFDIWWKPGINGIHMIVNAERPPYDNPKVREAFNLAIHRQPLIDNLGFGRFSIGKSMGPNNPFGLPDEEILSRPGFRDLNGKKHPDDIARARQLWSEAGFGPDNILKGTIISPGSRVHQDQAQIFKEQLTEVLVHIDLTFRPMETGAWVADLRKGNYDLSSSGMGGRADDPDGRFQALYMRGPRNWAYHEVEGVKELFERQSRELDPVKRREIVQEMQRLVLDSAPATMETLWETQGNLIHKRIMTKVGHYVLPLANFQALQHYHEWLLPETPDRPAFGVEGR